MRSLRLVLALAALLSLTAAAPTPAVAAKTKCKGTRGFVAGKPTCLRVGARCTRAHRADYLAADLVCVRRKVKGRRRLVLRPASLRRQRHGRVLDLGPSGRMTFKQAKWDFDATVAPLPGVKAPRGAVGRDREGTSAIGWLTRYRKRLTRAQRKVLRRVLTAHGPHRTLRSAAGGARVEAGPGLGDMPEITIQAKARVIAHGLPIRHTISLTRARADKGDEFAHMVPGWLTGGPDGSCEITYRPSLFKTDLATRRRVAAHELVHCAQAELLKTDTQFTALPAYFKEGFPEWAGYRIAVEWSGAIGSGGWWSTYLRDPRIGVRTRSYDAVGWWSLVEHEGVDLWKLFPSLVAGGGTGDTTKPYSIARIAGGGQALDADWGSTLATDGSLGARWNLDGPGMPKRAEPGPTNIGEGMVYPASAREAGANEFAVNLQADVIALQGNEHAEGRMRDAGGGDHAIPHDITRFCTVEDGCECPDGTKLPFEQIPPGVAHVGFAAPVEATAIVVAGESIEENCKAKPVTGIEVRDSSKSVVARFLSGTCAVKNGVFTAHAADAGYTLDVHINAFDGYGRTYMLAYNSADPGFDLNGPGGPYSNLYHPPEYPPGGGAIVFDDKGTRMSLGFLAAFNSDYSDARLLVGAMSCKKPKKT